jgi:predicted ribosome quality control (RQC) complex YloA/Tae2 family protein
MWTYTSIDGINIKVGENAKDNDKLTASSYPNEWWMHVCDAPGSHVVICHEDDIIPKETRRDAAVLAVKHSKAHDMSMVPVDLVRVEDVISAKNHGQVHLTKSAMILTVFPNKEKPRIERLSKTRH